MVILKIGLCLIAIFNRACAILFEWLERTMMSKSFSVTKTVNGDATGVPFNKLKELSIRDEK